MTPFLVCFLAGLIIGAIVNWLADQLPLLHADDEEEAALADPAETAMPLRLEKLRRPACVRCGSPRHILAYTGLTSWILGKRRCEQCGHGLSFRNPLVEVLLGVLFAYLFGRFGWTLSLLTTALYLTLFVLIAVIDIEHRYILNVIMIPAFVVALIEVTASGRLMLRGGLLGYAVAQIVVMGIYLGGSLYLWSINRGREEQVTEVAFGFGDVTLATFCGLILGYPEVVYMLVLMVVFGGFFAFLYVVFRLVAAGRYRGHVPIAYGPGMLLATTVMLLWPEVIMQYVYGPR